MPCFLQPLQKCQQKMIVIVKNAIVLLSLIAAAFRKQDANAPIALVEIIANVATNLTIGALKFIFQCTKIL